MILLKIRCARCRRTLTEVRSRPADWTGSLTFPACRRCYLPDPRRLVDVMLRKGVDGMPVGGALEWEGLRADIERAETRARTSDVFVRIDDAVT